jgi:signal transduction histidine kinase
MRAAVLVTLIVYLAAMLTLTTTLPAIWAMARDATRTSHSAMADAVAVELSRVPQNDAQTYEREVERLRGIYPIVSVINEPATDAKASRHDGVQTRTVHGKPIAVRFASDLKSDNLMRRGLLAATAAALAGLTLLGIAGFDFLMLLSNLRGGRTPGSASESSSMVATLETSIQAMKGREKELRVLHDRARERAAELDTITSTLVRSLTSGFIALDEDGRILDVNLAARELLRDGLTFTGLAPAAAIHRPHFAEALQRAVDGREAFQRHEVTEDDGAAFGLTTVPLLDDAGRYFGMLALFVDLTPVRGLEQRVRQMQSLADLGEMSAGIAHEFRNSLSTVLGYLNLARKSTLPAEAEERIGRAEEEARQLNGAVASLLAYARPMELALQPVDLRSLIDEVVEQIRPMATTVDIAVSGNGASILGDPLLLKRVVENVLRNAIESIREKGLPGRVNVTVAANPSPTITVRDNGVGVDPSRSATLFLPFQSTKRDGFGLGLALTRKIVLLHDGTVSLTGEPGLGATLEIRFQ